MADNHVETEDGAALAGMLFNHIITLVYIHFCNALS